jgi:hypothetical protein
VVAATGGFPDWKFRGKNNRWTRGESELAVIRLALVVPDPETLRRVEQMYSVKRALQRDAAAVVEAYWAGDVRRADAPAAWRKQLGLSREGMERRAYRHMEHSRYLERYVSKALVMQQADDFFVGVNRHLFPDATGKRFGRPKTGRRWDHTRIPSRARSRLQLAA